MLDAWHDLPLGRTVGSTFVSDHHTWRTPSSFQKLSHQTLCSLGIAATLHQNVKDEAILIDSAPTPVSLTGDDDDNLIEVSLIAEPAGRSLADIVGEVSAEFLRPQPHGLVRDVDATRCQQILDHAQAERKPEIQPHGMGNHVRWKSVTTIKTGTDE
jgi:hypothetical protein